MIGWNIRMARELREQLEGVKERNEAISVIREWWERPENETPRADARTALEAARGVNAFAASFDEHLSHVIEKAATSRGAWDGLKEYARSELDQNRGLSLTIQKALIADERPNTKERNKGQKPGGRSEGQKPRDYAAEMQRAAIIWALRSETPFKKLTSNEKSPLSAYGLAHEALERYGVTFDAFRSACRRHRDIFGGE